MALTDDLVAWWALDESSGTRSDTVGSSDLLETGTVGSTTGKINSAADLPGSSGNYLSCADNAALSTGDVDFSLSVWFYLDSTASHQMILKKDGEYSIRYISGAGIRFYLNAAVVVSSVTLSSGTWYHAVCYHDAAANTLGVYLLHDSSSPETASDAGHGAVDGANALNVGRDPNGDTEYFNGRVDLLGLWKRVLTSSEVSELYNGGSGLDHPFAATYDGSLYPYALPQFRARSRVRDTPLARGREETHNTFSALAPDGDGDGDGNPDVPPEPDIEWSCLFSHFPYPRRWRREVVAYGNSQAVRDEEGGGDEVVYLLPPEFIVTDRDNVHNPAYVCNVVAVNSGLWSEPSTWSNGRVPRQGDVVAIPSPYTVIQNVDGTASVAAVGIGSGGTLTTLASSTTLLNAGTIVVLEGGRYEVGTAASPIGASQVAEILFPDGSIDIVYDPFQYTRGLLVFGEFECHGATKSSGPMELAVEPLAGDTVLLLVEAPEGWRAGDKLVLHDTRQFHNEPYPWDPGYANQDEIVTIQSVFGAGVTLTAPLAFNHRGCRDYLGAITRLPKIANLTRNVLFHSAAPEGVRAHVMMTHHAHVHVRYSEWKDMGRTTNAMLNNTTGTYGNITNVGTNQVGRYSLHFHHIHRHDHDPVFVCTGNSTWQEALTPRKWGITIHNTPYGLCNRNVVYNQAGAGIMCEAGTEINTRIEDNFVSTTRAPTLQGLSSPDARGWGSDTGFEGYGIWLRGTTQIVRRNYVANSIGGISFYNTALDTAVTVAAGPLESDGTVVINPYAYGVQNFDDNEICGGGGCLDALTFWDLGATGNTPVPTATETVVRNLITWHVSSKHFTNYRDFRLRFENWICRGDFQRMQAGQGVTAVYGADYVAEGLAFRNCDIQGCLTGFYASAQGLGQTVSDTFFACYYDVRVAPRWGVNSPINARPRSVHVNNCTHATLGFTLSDVPPRSAVRTSNTDFLDAGQTSLILLDHLFVVQHQGDPNVNFRVFSLGSRREDILPQTIGTGEYPTLRGSPDVGLTNEQNFATYGICYWGDLPPPTSELTTRSDVIGYVLVQPFFTSPFLQRPEPACSPKAARTARQEPLVATSGAIDPETFGNNPDPG